MKIQGIFAVKTHDGQQFPVDGNLVFVNSRKVTKFPLGLIKVIWHTLTFPNQEVARKYGGTYQRVLTEDKIDLVLPEIHQVLKQPSILNNPDKLLDELNQIANRFFNHS